VAGSPTRTHRKISIRSLTTAGSTTWWKLGKACRRHCASASTGTMMRSSRHEPRAELERHALRVELPFGEPYRRLTCLPCVRWHATELPLRLLHTGMQATGVSSTPANVAQHRRSGLPAQGTPTSAVVGGAYRIRVFAAWRAFPRRAPLRRLQFVRTLDRTWRQLSGVRAVIRLADLLELEGMAPS
jgi:hypothetical protein